MRVLAVSDQVSGYLHSSAVTEYARGVDLIVSCGDLPADYLEYLATLLNAPLFYVMGNHGGAGGEKTFPDGGENLDGQVIAYKGMLFAGLEGSMRYNNRPQFQYTENEMRAKVAAMTPALMLNRARYGRYLDVLVTHAPPFGIHDDTDLPHRGFKTFVWFIDYYQPRYLLHGHKHVLDAREETVTARGVTQIINTFGHRLLEIEPFRPRSPKKIS